MNTGVATQLLLLTYSADLGLCTAQILNACVAALSDEGISAQIRRRGHDQLTRSIVLSPTFIFDFSSAPRVVPINKQKIARMSML